MSSFFIYDMLFIETLINSSAGLSKIYTDLRILVRVETLVTIQLVGQIHIYYRYNSV